MSEDFIEDLFDGGGNSNDGAQAKAGPSTGGAQKAQSNGSAGTHGAHGNSGAASGAVADQPPVLNSAAYYGIAGEVVRKMAPQTEASPVALLLQFLIYGGNAIGRGPHFRIGDDLHFANLFGMLVGDTSKARKGLSAGHIRKFYTLADPAWAEHCIRSGMSSGEGLIWHVRDKVMAMRKGVLVEVDAGIADKRMLLDEREFQSALAVMQRSGNTLSDKVRRAWDCEMVLETMTKNEPVRATKPFFSIVGHITADELKESLDRTEMANGYANRFLFAYVSRSKLLPLGGQRVDLAALAGRAKRAIEAARGIELVAMSPDAEQVWCASYPALTAAQPGLLGAITARAEAQTLRMSLVYALLDGAREIDCVHVRAALALWAYCKASARFVFGDLLGNTAADTILASLRKAAPAGMTRTEISDVFGFNRASGDIARALQLLLTAGKARFEKPARPPGQPGRTPETWFAI